MWPRATWLDAMSTITGSPGVGNPAAIGLVPRYGVRAPGGDMAGGVLVNASPTSPPAVHRRR